jgi:ABC-2 type transport system permease protein
MTATLLLHQLRFDVLAARRNRRTQFFAVALPILLLVTFAGLFGKDTVDVVGHQVAGNRATIPGIMGLAVLTSSFMALAMTVAGQRQAGILKRRRATPVPASVLIVSRALTATATSVTACLLMLVVASVAYDIHPPHGWLAPTLMGIIAGSLCFAGLGYAIAGLITTPESSGPLVQVVLLPLQMISGVYFPASQLPDWLHTVANVFPLIHLTNALQHAFLPTGAQVAWGDLGIMALWAVGAAAVAARTFRWLPKKA